ncbi:DUF1707 SHOCT-like domain-containing protein [Paractinoplanes lichenicola]|uniref:DUF1707 domain-containing protein n=1 Tax=Paractinoplanes lichenicola TaxID=2802976 RepID=A0ABS1W0G2_9ACTN|nr:DUF1707 domain-containing protein [Actinoplanes lichenicola]MBL7260200.1 DUF1707 domain-containing protein [Actinoplanes lichenicola]
MNDIAARLPQAEPDPARIRCSDADRERVSARLRDAAGEGRLTMEELDERLSAVYDAKHHDELTPLTADLPRNEQARTGWRRIIALLRAQLITELMILRGRVPGASRFRRLIVAATLLLMVLFLIGSVAGALHGFGGEGFEHHGGLEHGGGLEGPGGD